MQEFGRQGLYAPDLCVVVAIGLVPVYCGCDDIGSEVPAGEPSDMPESITDVPAEERSNMPGSEFSATSPPGEPGM